MKPSTPQDILLIIKELKNSNSTGYDEICTKVVKYVSPIIAPVLCHVVNLCIEMGTCLIN